MSAPTRHERRLADARRGQIWRDRDEARLRAALQIHIAWSKPGTPADDPNDIQLAAVHEWTRYFGGMPPPWDTEVLLQELAEANGTGSRPEDWPELVAARNQSCKLASALERLCDLPGADVALRRRVAWSIATSTAHLLAKRPHRGRTQALYATLTDGLAATDRLLQWLRTLDPITNSRLLAAESVVDEARFAARPLGDGDRRTSPSGSMVAWDPSLTSLSMGAVCAEPLDPCLVERLVDLELTIAYALECTAVMSPGAGNRSKEPEYRFVESATRSLEGTHRGLMQSHKDHFVDGFVAYLAAFDFPVARSTVVKRINAGRRAAMESDA